MKDAYIDVYAFLFSDFLHQCIYSQTSVVRTSLGPWKFVRDV